MTGQHSQDMTTIILLTPSNIFMTFAWYGHLRYRSAPIFKVIVVSCSPSIVFKFQPTASDHMSSQPLN
jgi:uncharacterized protein (DUF486 family)